MNRCVPNLPVGGAGGGYGALSDLDSDPDPDPDGVVVPHGRDPERYYKYYSRWYPVHQIQFIQPGALPGLEVSHGRDPERRHTVYPVGSTRPVYLVQPDHTKHEVGGNILQADPETRGVVDAERIIHFSDF